MENSGKVGVWLIGALGSISTTLIMGTAALKKGLIPPTGIVTETNLFEGVELAGISDLVFGGCDIRCADLFDVAYRSISRSGAVDRDILDAVRDELDAVGRNLCMGTAKNCGEAIGKLADSGARRPLSLREEIAVITEDLLRFKETHGLDRVVVVNLASTEPPLKMLDCHRSPDALEACFDRNDTEAVRACTLYAWAAVSLGFPYINFTPSNGALTPAVLSLAETSGAPVMGNDGKTGETLVKSALAPMFLCRNLEVLSWEGFNILGNMDGSVLDHPDNRESKIRTKDKVLGDILGYTPHSRVHINYVPSLDDQKTAWDFIHFRGFLGARMSLQFTWQGYDSILAAPVVLDLVRLADLAARRGEAGLMPHLASWFKAPQGVSEQRLGEQVRMLEEYVRTARGCDPAPLARKA